MIAEKELRLQQYFELSVKVLKVLHQGAEEQLLDLLEQRDVCIAAINELDARAGNLLMNETITGQLNRIAELEKEIQSQLQLAMKKLSSRVRSEQRNQYIKNQYEDLTTVSKGVFYDRKK
ncbi:hypothetical protein [Neobacillus mesonae]|uniref:hypothetical protein n=1 Tax=Neobacillus mesonae TaxID=1193713 RepID=UPI002E1F621C|nr:hypothetical protein [Neobacillus mesonae]